MGRFYIARVAPSALTAKADILEFTCAADKPQRLWYVHLYQTTELGDAAEEQLEVTIERGVTAGTGGGSITMAAIDRDIGASDGSCAGIRTTAHTGGTIIWDNGWMIRQPYDFWWTDLTAPTIDAATDPWTVTVSAPADSTTIGGMALIEEL